MKVCWVVEKVKRVRSDGSVGHPHLILLLHITRVNSTHTDTIMDPLFFSSFL